MQRLEEPMSGRVTTAERHAVVKRRDDALTLRLAGVDYVTIGRKLAADPTVNSDGLGYPRGYGIDAYVNGEPPPDDDTLAKLVRDDLGRVYRQRRANLDHNLDDLRDLQDARLERLFAEAWRAALTAEDPQIKLAGIDRAVKLMERQARLHGLDAPARTEISGPQGGPIELTTAEKARAAALAHLAVVQETSPCELADTLASDDDDDDEGES
jgi:hypothetical protein